MFGWDEVDELGQLVPVTNDGFEFNTVLLGGSFNSDMLWQSINEMDYATAFAEEYPRRILTVVETDGETMVHGGWHFCNRVGYILLEKPIPEEFELGEVCFPCTEFD
jgi:hypothetical protein